MKNRTTITPTHSNENARNAGINLPAKKKKKLPAATSSQATQHKERQTECALEK